MTWIRASGFFLSKITKSLFEHVYVNSEQVEKIRPLLTKYPVIFMPSHRSYMDFLLLSFVLFQYSLPCPVICAAQVKPTAVVCFPNFVVKASSSCTVV